MSAEIQSFISDFFHRRGISDPDGYALKAAASVAKIGKWNEENISKALTKPRTELFLRNQKTKKADLLVNLSSQIFKRIQPPTVDAEKDTCNILFLTSNPSDQSQLDIGEELREITEKIRKSDLRDRMNFNSKWALRPDDLLQILNEQEPDILHFSGHGTGIDGLVLSNNLKKTALVSNDALDALFRIFKGKIRVVILNACYSDKQVTSIIKHIDCVIGMNDSIKDDSAKFFAASFYRAIGFGHSVQNAFEQAIESLILENTGDEDLPVLRTRKGIDPKKIILVKP